jgi:hypothetical protein
MSSQLRRDEEEREQRMREHSDRHGKDQQQDQTNAGRGDAYKDRNYKRDAGDFDSGDPSDARREGDLAHIAKTALPPGITPGDLFDPGSQPTELESDRARAPRETRDTNTTTGKDPTRRGSDR